MDSLLTERHSTWRLLIATTVLLALVMALGAASASASPDCRAQNTVTGMTYTALQDAVDAAESGARLVVRGICRGGTVIDTSLVIEGIGNATSGKPILDGDHRTRVLLIETEARVELRSLVIRGGNAHIRQWGRGWDLRHPRNCLARDIRCGWIGGGINNKGTLTLRDVVVRDNQAWFVGGGISNTGTLSLWDSHVIDNRAQREGGGINSWSGKVTLHGHSRISGNRTYVGGGVNVEGGLVTLNDRSSITDNVATQSSGISINRKAKVVLNDDSHISRNRGSLGGGGVHNYGAVTLNDRSRVSHNTSLDGGGIDNSGSVTMNDGSRVSLNTATSAGGIDNFGTVTLNDRSRIMGNTARWSGGGTQNHGTVTLNDDASIDGNALLGPFSDSPASMPPGRGAGIYNEGSLTMTGSSRIFDNEARVGGNGLRGQGGGLYSAGRSTLIGVNCAPHTYANVHRNSPDDCHFWSP